MTTTGHDTPTRDPAALPTSWQPADLADTVAGLLGGTIARPAPTIGYVTNGLALFYPGKVNGIAGESGSGKSWTALLVCAQQITDGEHSLYIDFEDDAASIVARLLDMGAAPEAIVARFHYVHPHERFDVVATEAVAALLDTHHPTVAVIDSTGEALSLDGLRPNEDDDVARWFRNLPAGMAARGPAVIVLDHVTKADDSGLWPIGSQRKRAAISGAQYMQRAGRPFAKGHPGEAVLICAKDRHGTYRINQRVARLTVDPDGDQVTVQLVTADNPTADAAGFRPTTLMKRVSDALAAAPEPLTTRAIRERVNGKSTAIAAATDALIREGNVTTAPGPRGATLHHLHHPYDDGNHSTPATGSERPVTGSRLRDGKREPVTPPVPGTGGEPVRNQEPGACCPTCAEPLNTPGATTRCRPHHTPGGAP
ncbi:AAA family ATPase [Cellulomonas iranensis]|uniref:AAA+ ATPase domain-containing protein n=1 Tax=Cellulomonas iranensis TaxID=76862 RepID=A0ABU0GG12_9CELL|nr:AAA family ATPase [Cellulomonas iranensis]MDQ0424291.1 hypothetical protein [Cellulomonas iranensis]